MSVYRTIGPLVFIKVTQFPHDSGEQCRAHGSFFCLMYFELNELYNRKIYLIWTKLACMHI